MHYSVAGFPHALLVWAYETLPSIALKFSTKYDHAIPRMLSWTTADNVKFDDVMSAFTEVDENQVQKLLVDFYILTLFIMYAISITIGGQFTYVNHPSCQNSIYLF